MKRQAASAKCRWIFLSRCTANNVTPKSFRTRQTLQTRKGQALTEEYDQRMLKATRDSVKQQYHTYLKKINETNRQIKEAMSEEDFKTINDITEISRENQFQKESKRLKDKFEELRKKQAPKADKERETKLKYEVIDLTKDGIDEDVRAYLKLGPDFCETPQSLPYEKIIIKTEVMCKIIE